MVCFETDVRECELEGIVERLLLNVLMDPPFVRPKRMITKEK